MEQSLTGQLVTLSSARGPIQRVVVSDMGDVIAVTTPEEWRASRGLGNTPVSIGFRRSDVIDHPGIDMTVSLKSRTMRR